MPPIPDPDVAYTYRYLRGAMVALLLMLVFSVAYQWWWGTDRSCVLGSISAYYYTPVRTVFVGSLCALGAALIAYKGHSAEEDLLLNFSGLMAFVVAMVPTVPDTSCGVNGFSPTSTEVSAAVGNNVWSLIVVAVGAAVYLVWRWLRRDGARPQTSPNTRAVVASIVCVSILVAEVVLFLLLPEQFISLSHGIAASTMVVGVIAVMVLNALDADNRHEQSATARRYKRIYRTIAILLFGLLALTVGVSLVASRSDHLILTTELIILALFGVYWAVQSFELRPVEQQTPMAVRTARVLTH